MIIAALCVAVVGSMLGFIQSLLVGLYAGSWDGGTGLLWGSIVGLLSLLLAFWLQWHGMWGAVLIAGLIGTVSGWQVYVDKGRGKKKQKDTDEE